MNHTEIAARFYKAFCNGDASGMTNCYSNTILFSDPAFGPLEAQRAKAMWHMLLERSDGELRVQYHSIEETQTGAIVQWTATYPYGPKKRTVTNKVTATLHIENDAITKHHDSFDLYKWSKQALGITGYLLGWSGYMQTKIQEKTNKLLTHYMQKNAAEEQLK